MSKKRKADERFPAEVKHACFHCGEVLTLINTGQMVRGTSHYKTRKKHECKEMLAARRDLRGSE